ncbi:hypothetical protein CARUB_v10003734mg [Capsella rubella]|uniref:Uncharacterized protein n=1 Tax=Capsella rubella TaxID=81985 RepID=R0FKH3_9BRAS|nr:hypothetical protein CARUB_v10003734mg [Capsella rubella]
MMVTAHQILFSLIRYNEPDDEASSSYKDVSDATLPARTTYYVVIFVAGSVMRNKGEMLSISQKGTLSGNTGPGTLQVRRTLEVTTMSRNLTHRPKRCENTPSSSNFFSAPYGLEFSYEGSDSDWAATRMETEATRMILCFTA